MPRYISQQQLTSELYNSPIALFYYDNSQLLVYSGTHKNFSAVETDSGWEIKRYWYDAYGNIVKIKKQTGIIDNRTTLDW